MPELPDVELYKRRLDECCLDREIRRVMVADARLVDGISLAEFTRRLGGARMTATRRHGKHLLVALDRGDWLALHFGMTGALLPFAADEEGPPYDRIRFDFADGGHLAYVNRRRLGRLGLVADAEAFIAEERLGPDALDPAFDRAALDRALGARRRCLKTLLMDQAMLAGIGNIYSDEILFQARLHPAAPSDGLDSAARRRLFDAIHSVLETAIDCGAGSEDFIERLPRHFLLRHRQKGGKCPHCDGPVATRKFSGRTGYFCPKCQPAPQ